MLTYIGFDGISTLTDEAKIPLDSVPRAIVLTCFITGVLASVEVYVAQLVWPRGLAFPDIDTAYVHVSGRMGGPDPFLIVNASLLLANMGSGMASQLGAARLLYAMGQDGALPRRFFGAVHPKNRIPRNNVLLVGAICLCGALLFSYQLGTELLNYGALLAFMGVNPASILRGWRTGRLRSGSPCCSRWAALPPARCSGGTWDRWRSRSAPPGPSSACFSGSCAAKQLFCPEKANDPAQHRRGNGSAAQQRRMNPHTARIA